MTDRPQYLPHTRFTLLQVYGIGHLGEDLREGVVQPVDLRLQLTGSDLVSQARSRMDCLTFVRTGSSDDSRRAKIRSALSLPQVRTSKLA